VSPFRPPFPRNPMCIRKVRAVFPRYPRLISPLATRHSSLATRHFPFIFIFLQTPSPTTPLFSHPYKTPRGVGVISVRFFTSHRSRVTSHARSVFHKSRVTSHKSRLFMGLPPLWRLQRSQLLCNQANPVSFWKTPGGGGYLFAPVRTGLMADRIDRGDS
jgi:hypothetical protein